MGAAGRRIRAIARKSWFPGVKTPQRYTVAKAAHSYVGVSQHKNTARFEAHVWNAAAINSTNLRRPKGRQIYCGTFATAEEAAKAYDRVARPLGKACNFPPSDEEVMADTFVCGTAEYYDSALIFSNHFDSDSL